MTHGCRADHQVRRDLRPPEMCCHHLSRLPATLAEGPVMLSEQNRLIIVRLRRLGAGALFRRLCSAIEIIGRVDQGDMRKGLRKIASGTPSPSLQRAMSGARRLMPASPSSRERSPLRPGTAHAFLVSGSTREPRFHRMQPLRRRGRSTGGILLGIQEPGHGGPPWHNVRATNPRLPFMVGSADHEAGRSKTPAPPQGQ